MKKMLFASALALVFVSCKKDKDEAENSITMETLAGTYTLGSVTIKMAGSSQETDFTTSMDECERDDRLTLRVNGSFTKADAGITCNPSTEENGTWSLTSNNTKIIMEGDEATIQSYSNGVLKLSTNESEGGINYTTTMTLNKQ